MSDYKFPTEIVKLPSQGLLYPETHPLSKGEVEMKYMTAREEDILTNINYIKQGIVLDKLLQSLIVTKFNYEDLLICDKEALLLASRILGYGKDYSFTITNQLTRSPEKITVDLTQLKEKEIDKEVFQKGKNEFEFELPHTKTNLSFKLLNIRDSKAIDAENEGLKKISSLSSFEITTMLKFMIVSVGTDRNIKTIREFVDKALLARDRVEFTKYVKKITPGINLKTVYDFGKGDEEVAIPIDINFFWPDE